MDEPTRASNYRHLHERAVKAEQRAAFAEHQMGVEIAAREKAEQQRDELLEALRYAIECGEKDGAASALAVLNTTGRAAIAKIEGENNE
jgi:hypothetical protein